LTELSKKAGVIVMAGFNRRYATGYMMAKDILSRKEFGPAVLFYSKFHANSYRSVEYYVFNHVVHQIDLACYLLGELENITVIKNIYTSQKGAYIVNFTAPFGDIGTLQSSCVLEAAYPMEYLDVSGLNGRNVTVDNLRDVRYNRSGPQRDLIHGLPLQDGGDCLAWNASNGYAFGYDYLVSVHKAGYFVDRPCICIRKCPF
jgi:predicted dehydrogenase